MEAPSFISLLERTGVVPEDSAAAALHKLAADVDAQAILVAARLDLTAAPPANSSEASPPTSADSISQRSSSGHTAKTIVEMARGMVVRFSAYTDKIRELSELREQQCERLRIERQKLEDEVAAARATAEEERAHMENTFAAERDVLAGRIEQVLEEKHRTVECASHEADSLRASLQVYQTKSDSAKRWMVEHLRKSTNIAERATAIHEDLRQRLEEKDVPGIQADRHRLSQELLDTNARLQAAQKLTQQLLLQTQHHRERLDKNMMDIQTLVSQMSSINKEQVGQMTADFEEIKAKLADAQSELMALRALSSKFTIGCEAAIEKSNKLEMRLRKTRDITHIILRQYQRELQRLFVNHQRISALGEAGKGELEKRIEMIGKAREEAETRLGKIEQSHGLLKTRLRCVVMNFESRLHDILTNQEQLHRLGIQKTSSLKAEAQKSQDLFQHELRSVHEDLERTRTGLVSSQEESTATAHKLREAQKDLLTLAGATESIDSALKAAERELVEVMEALKAELEVNINGRADPSQDVRKEIKALRRLSTSLGPTKGPAMSTEKERISAT